MRLFLRRVLIYLLPLFLLFILLEAFYRIIPNDYTVKFATIPNRYESTEILIFGNSHNFYGLNPKYFNRVTYNMANISQPIYFDKILFDTYLDKFKNIKCIVLNIEYTSLSEQIDAGENNWRKYYYRNYMHLNVPSIKTYDWTNYFLSSTRSFNANTGLVLRYLKDGSIVNCDDNGFGINYTKEKKKALLKKDALIRVKNIEDNLLNFEENIARVQSIINTCKNRGIKVVLLNMPVSIFFAEGVNQFKLNKIQETCTMISNKNYNVSYLNLFKDKRFTNEDFFDADHLHKDGAKKCSKIVDTFINEVLKND